jgi:methylmalonyl-CoA mutase N-terminal domain/subunit
MIGMPLLIEQSDLMSDDTNGKPNRSLSGLEVKPVYTPDDLANTDFARDLGQPGEFPFTRGP